MKERPKKPDIAGILSDVEAATFTTDRARDTVRALVDSMAVGQAINLEAALIATDTSPDTFRKWIQRDPRVAVGTYNRPSGQKGRAYRRIK